MNFNELFERYRSGTATGEERRIVEAEVEKISLINDYLCGQWDDPLPAAPAGEFVQVKRSLRKRNTLLVVTSLVLTAVLMLGVFRFAVPLAESRYFDPTRATYSDTQTDLEIALECYYELFSPEQYFYGIETMVDTGFASWTMDLSYHDWDSPDRTGYRTVQAEKGDVSFPRGTLYYSSTYLFDMGSQTPSSFDPLSEDDVAHVLYELDRFPEDTELLAAVSFVADLTVEELLELQAIDTVTIGWTGVRTARYDQTPSPLIGVDLYPGREDCGVNAFYPDLQLGMVTAETLESHFRSLIQYCRDYEENVLNIGVVTEEGYYDRVLEYLDRNGMKFYGCYMTGTRADFLRLIKTGYIMDLRVVQYYAPYTYSPNTPSFGG